MNVKILAILTAVAGVGLYAPNANAQAAGQNNVLVIYGDDKCPTNSNGDEIVVCQRLDERERFRIPKTLREQPGRPQATESWAIRSQDALDAGAIGTGSCSTVGAGGSIGCQTRNIRQAKAEANARKEEQENLPLP